jgi:hypothetical protein
MFLLKGHKWHLLRILFTGVEMGGYSSVDGDLMFFAPKKPIIHSDSDVALWRESTEYVSASFLCKSKNE